MSTQRRALPLGLARRATTLAVAMATAVVTLLIVAAPARAADAVGVDINNLPGNMTPGVPSYFRVGLSLADKNQKSIANVHVVISVHLDGMPADAVHVQKQFGADLSHSGGGDGTVRFTDSQQTTVQGRTATLNFILLFSGNAPSGTANLTVEAYQDNNRLGGQSKTTKVRGNGQGPGQAPTTAPPNTNPGYVPTFDPAPSYSVAALPQSDTVRISATVPKSLYWLGGLLIAMGVLVLFLIFRRQPGAGSPAAAGGPDDRRPGPATARPAWLRRPTFPSPGPAPERRPPDGWPRQPRS